MKKCYDAQIGQAMNGVIVKIGCKLFVGMPKDLEALSQYFDGKIPDGLKKAIKPETAFLGQMPRQGERLTPDGIEDLIQLPNFVNTPGVTIISAVNGWIIVKRDGSAWVAKTAKDAATHLGIGD